MEERGHVWTLDKDVDKGEGGVRESGRDMVLWVARKRCGLTLRELGKAVMGMEYFAVSKAITRLSARLKTQKPLRLSLRRVENYLSNVQT